MAINTKKAPRETWPKKKAPCDTCEFHHTDRCPKPDGGTLKNYNCYTESSWTDKPVPDNMPSAERRWGNHYFGQFMIPARMRPDIHRYINDRIKPGDFLTAIIKNNLADACKHADQENLRNLPAYVDYFYNHTPTACWGSPKRMADWLKGDKNGK